MKYREMTEVARADIARLSQGISNLQTRASVGENLGDSHHLASGGGGGGGTPMLTSNKAYDAVVFDVLMVNPEDFASQLTLMDISVFKKIKSEELSNCRWNQKDKAVSAQNVVEFTKRFNYVSFWTVQQVLNAQTPKCRADILVHFIKIAKKLHELNNLHSEFAIVSALQSVPVFRLAKTWAQVSKKDRGTLEKLAELFSDKDNFIKLREFMSNVKLPCIPYLGLYLTDLTYIRSALLSTTSSNLSLKFDKSSSSTQMKNVLETIKNLQKSNYALAVLPHVQSYLRSVRYIEELQKFVEEDNYKRSLKLEPPTAQSDLGRSRDDLSTVHPSVVANIQLQGPGCSQTVGGGRHKKTSLQYSGTHPAATHFQNCYHHSSSNALLSVPAAQQSSSCSSSSSSVSSCVAPGSSATLPANIPLQSAAAGGGYGAHNTTYPAGSGAAGPKFVPGHRKSRSLGTNIFTSCPQSSQCSSSVYRGRHLLDDSVLEDDSFPPRPSSVIDRKSSISSSGETNNGLDLGSDEIFLPLKHWRLFQFDGFLNCVPTNHALFFRRLNRWGIYGCYSCYRYALELFSGSEELHLPSPTSPNTCSPLGPLMLNEENSASFTNQGCVKRKTVLKEGRKPAVSSWMRYWIALWDTTLVYYQPKSLRGHERSDFKRTPFKMTSIVGWMVLKTDSGDPSQPDVFQLTDPSKGNVYKFRAGTYAKATEWCAKLAEAARTGQEKLPKNLMSFE